MPTIDFLKMSEQLLYEILMQGYNIEKLSLNIYNLIVTYINIQIFYLIEQVNVKIWNSGISDSNRRPPMPESRCMPQA